MKNLIIIGARKLGREVYSLAKQSNSSGNLNWHIKGFLDRFSLDSVLFSGKKHTS